MSPDDDEQRLVLADQLLARGDPLGEFISLSCRKAKVGSELDDESRGRLAELWNQHGKEFCSRFGGESFTLHFSRGLPTRLVAPAYDWLSGPELPAPIQRIELYNVAGTDVARIFSRPSTARLSGLTLRSTEAWGRTEARAIAAAKPPKLKHLGLHHAFTRSVDFNACLSGALFTQLSTLELGGPLGTEPSIALVPLNGRAHRLGRFALTDGIAEWPPHQYFSDGGAVYRTPWGAQLMWNAMPDEVGAWSARAVLGLRSGLIATHVQNRATAEPALLVKTHEVCAAYDGPAGWFSPPVRSHPALFEPIDSGDADDGLWQLFRVPKIRRIDELAGPRNELTPVEWAAAFAPLVRWLSEQEQPSIENCALFLSDSCVQLHRPAPHFRFWNSGHNLPPPWIAAEMPPEMLSSPSAQPTPVYRLAARIAALLGVQLASKASNLTDLFNSLFDFKPKVTRNDVPKELSDVLERALDRKPDARPSLKEFAEALERFRTPETANAPTRLQLPSLPERIDSLASVWLQTHSAFEPDRLT
jgi:uncharacterized protein (TIGR02996 family)